MVVRLWVGLVLCLFGVWEAVGEAAPVRDLGCDTWVQGEDPRWAWTPQTPPPMGLRADRTVGIFYFLWHGAHGTKGPFNLSRLREARPDDPAYGPKGQFHHWDEPELGYYVAPEPYVLRRHAQQLIAAGVDMVAIDVTNGFAYDASMEALFATWTAMRQEGNPTPQVAFLTHSRGEQTVRHLIDTWYAPKRYEPLWFRWQGKPLLLANPAEVPEAWRDRLTIRRSWAWSEAAWFGDGRDRWPWLDYSPQQPGWHVEGEPEQIPVAVSEHPTNNRGRSHQGGKQPAPGTVDPGKALYFREQWERALAVDPPFVFVTGWNEWVAQRFLKKEGVAPGRLLGEKLAPGDTFFVDMLDDEFNRDIEPVRGGYNDATYGQLITQVRRYKGRRAPPRPVLLTGVTVDGDPSDWRGQGAVYNDFSHDTVHRDAPGWGKAGPYRDASGRNDIVSVRVGHTRDAVVMLIETREPMTSPADPRWMWVCIDADQDAATGTLGYEGMLLPRPQHGTIEREPLGSGEARVWQGAQSAVQGRFLELAWPHQGSEPRFDFHVVDHPAGRPGEADFLTTGDHAPDRRFRYRYGGAPQ